MSRYLLDSDAIIDYLKGVATTIELIHQLGRQGHQLCTCDVVECEVYAGLPPAHRDRAEPLLNALEYLLIPRHAARQAGNWRRTYRTQGLQLVLQPQIGDPRTGGRDESRPVSRGAGVLATTDCLIAAVAHAHDAQLVTANLRDFPMPEVTVLPLPRATL